MSKGIYLLETCLGLFLDDLQMGLLETLFSHLIKDPRVSGTGAIE